MIGGMFGPGTRSNEQTQSPAQTVTSSYPQADSREQEYRLPDKNPLLADDIPEEQRRSGVWSLESHRIVQARNQTYQTPEPTLPPQPAVSQPQYTEVPPRIRQASGNASESEGVTPAAQSPPPLAPPTETRSNSLPAPPLVNATEIFVPVDTPETIDTTVQETPAANDVTPPAMLARRENPDISTPFLTVVANTEDTGKTPLEDSPDETETAEESSGTGAGDASMPPFYAQGEQKAEKAEKSKGSGFGLLPTSAGPTMTVLSSLAIVLGVFFVLVWLMKRATPRQGGLLPAEVFEKLGSVPLSPKMQLQLFRLGGKLVLVSVTPDGMEPVAEVTDPDEVIHLIGLCRQSDPKSASAAFRQVLKQYTGDKIPQQQQQPMTGGYAQQPVQQYPAQQYQQQPYPAQQYPKQQFSQGVQQAVRRPVGMVTPARAYQR